MTYLDPVPTRFVVVNNVKSVHAENRQTLAFYVWLRDNNNNLMSPYEGPVMNFVEEINLLIESIEE